MLSQITQTESDHEGDANAESSDFPPIKIGNNGIPRSPASAMCHNVFPLSNEEPPQLRLCQQHNTGLGKSNILNMTAPVQKVTLNALCR